MRILLFLLLTFVTVPATWGTGHLDLEDVLQKAEQLRSQGRLDEARKLLDSLYSGLTTEFNKKYDSEIVPVRTTYNAHAAELEAREYKHKLVIRLCYVSLTLFLAGLLFYLFIRRESKQLARSSAEMKEAAERAEMAERSKSMFLSNMTHEIRTPLNAISGFSDVLAIEGIDEDMRREAADIIEMNSRLLQNLIDDVVDTACLDLREMKFRIVACDVVKLGRNVTEMISKIKKTDAEMSFESDESMLMVMADPLRLQQVMVNVIVNATKFCKEGSIVTRVDAEPTGARISVTDTGIGIPKEKQASVFRRFERVGETAEGFGLGLSICQFIVERMGGRIWVDGEYTGGARFVFTVPFESPDGEKGGEA